MGNLDLADLSVRIVAPLVVALILFTSKSVHRWLTRSGRAGIVLLVAIVLALTVCGLVPAYVGARSNLDGAVVSTAGLSFILGALFLQASLVYVLYLVKRSSWPARTEPPGQYDTRDAQHVTVPNKKKGHKIRTIAVQRLNAEPGPLEGRLCIDWRTFWDGTDSLIKQIQDHVPTMELDLCVGVNAAGGAVAALLAGALSPLAPIPLEFVRAKGQDHIVEQVEQEDRCLPPPEHAIREILVADGEVKTGTAIENVVKFLKGKYGEDTVVRVAAMCASQVKKRIKHIQDLRDPKKGLFNRDPEYLPDFIAFTCSSPVRLSRHYIR